MARLALLLALPLGFWTAGAQAQDTAVVLPRVHVLPPDSAGFFNRMRYREFLRQLPTITPPLVLSLPFDRPFGAVDTGRIGARFDAAVAAITADSEAAARRSRAFRRLYSFAIDTNRDQTDRGLFGLSKTTADVSFDGTLEFHISSSRQHNLACTPAQVLTPGSGCTGGFTAPRIDNLVQLHSEGVFDQRFHINIDFDSKRDYAAGNIISGYYQGLVDEKLQRVEIGTQFFRPPPSRFLTATIPSNNFGIGATAVFGPLRLDAIAATQKGSVVATKTYTIGNGSTVQPQDKLTRDLDYEPDRVFWVVDPRTLTGYPSLDILNAGSIAVPADQQPAEVRIYRYVSANQGSGASANYDGITALGFNGAERTGALRWRLLKANVDYWLDPSGLWFVMANGRIDPSDYLAVSYRTKTGALIGSFPSTDNAAAKDSLQLIFVPNRGPASPVFPYEMRQIYRVAGTSLVRSSLRAAILVSNSERPANGPGTFLSLLGLAVPADQASLDVENRVFPRTRDPGASQVVKDALLIFPSVQPFSSAQLSAGERNDSLYATPEYLLFSQGPPSIFQLHLQFDAQSGTDRSGIRLDAVQITEGSEHIDVNGRRLTRGIDYAIDYLTGEVSFLDPVSLFGAGTATVTASFEERGLFAQAPTSIAGLTATWTLGQNKSISFSGLYQAEATGYTRPPIGYEPRASLLAGFTGNFLFDTPGVTRFLNGLVTRRSTAPSSLALSGELALSHPDPNRSGDAYLEEFEDDHSVRLSAGESVWRPGSVPQSAVGLESVVGQRFDSADAVQLTWQNLVPNAARDITLLAPQDIDPTIAATSSSTPTTEPVMWMTLHADTAGGIVDFNSRSHWTQPARPGRPRWRSMTTALSTTGADLSRNDYFEFALYETSDMPVESSQLRIIVDLGRVSEDALAIAPDSFRVLGPGESFRGLGPGDTVYTGRQYVGVGSLNSEKTVFGTWDATTDDIGILADRPDSIFGPGGALLRRPALCTGSLTATIRFFPWGDLGSRCTNHNGIPDTEDLDGDNVLNAQGSADDVFRYVVDLRDSARYFVRRHVVTDVKTHLPIVDQFGRTASWTIYRVPLRTATDTIGSPDMHLVKQMRLTFAAPAADSEPVLRWAMALMKLTGAAWIARADRPIKSLSGPTAQFHGSVVIGSVSTQDSDTLGLGYTSPPGIGNAAGTVTVSQSQAPQQINERSLRIQVTDLHQGERAEAYTRLVAGTQNLLSYRQLRVWVHGRGEGWNNGPLQAYVKVGSDAFNFYLYRAPAQTGTWVPEMVIDLQTWLDLRQKVENDRLHGLPPNGAAQCGGDSTAYVACTPDGAYVVQERDPQINPPNLAAVQELAAGIYYNSATGPPIGQTELWVDDIRVSQPVSTTGFAGALNARLVASDVATFDLASVVQNGQFHLMGQAPTFQDAATLVTSSTVHLEKFLPQHLGLLVPASVSSSWGWVNPQLIGGSDVQAGGLAGLRRPRNDATTWQISVSHPLRQNAPRMTRWFLNPWSLSASGSAATNITSLSQATASAWTASLGYFLNNQRRAYPIHLSGLTRGLPRWLRESAAGRGLANASFAPVPTQVQFSSTLSHTMGELQSFQLPIRVLADTILKPVTSEQFLWRNSAGLSWDPFTIMHFTSSLSSTRDLRRYGDSTTLGRVVNAKHRSLLGTDVGVERDRNLTNSFSIAPRIASWLGPSLSVGTNFVLSRSLTSRNPVRIDGDTAGAYILPQTLDNSRVIEFRITLDPRLLAQRVFGDSSAVSRATVRMRPIEFSRRRTLQSTFDLARFNPGLGYQLALGSFASFLARNGQEAIGAVDATSSAAAASVDLPSGFTAQLNYTTTTSNRYQHKSGPTGFLTTIGTTEAWPSGRFSWSRTFRNGPVTTLTAGSVIERDRATSFSPFGDGTASTTISETRRVTPNLTIVFRNGIFATFAGEFDNSSGSSSGNLTQTVAGNLTGTLSWGVRMPRFLSATRRSLETNVTVTQSTNTSCIQRTSDSSCVPYYALSRLDVETGFTALLQRAIRTGLQLGYVHNAVRSLGLLSSTITISVFFSIPLSGLGM